jgi:hypothetical protein
MQTRAPDHTARCSRRMLGIVLAAGSACSASGREQPDTPAVVAAAPPAAHTASEPFDAEATAAALSGPSAVASLLVQWDTAGFTRGGVGAVSEEIKARDSLLCYLPETHCDNVEGGWDAFTVVSGYTVRLLWQRGDSAEVRVDYAPVAAYAPSEASPNQVVRSNEPFVWTPRFLRMSGRWQVTGVESAEHPALSIAAARRAFARTRADTALLDSLARDSRGRRDR